jgi:putative acetyltransferase
MMIRPAKIDDAQAICALHERSIMQLCANDYTPEQIRAWSSGPPERFVKIINQSPYMAVFETANQIAGFVTLKPDLSIWQLYIDPDFIGRGIGSNLLETALDFATSTNMREISTKSSLTAQRFYERHGFKAIRPETIEIRGVFLPAIAMTRILEK